MIEKDNMIPILNEQTLLANIAKQQNPFHTQYYAFYSSWFKGIIKDPKLMLVPVDDHLVHRGDGVFEAMKVINRSIYLYKEHIERLFVSAAKIDLLIPYTKEQLLNIILQTLHAANRNEAVIRLFLARGPGGFAVNPYDSVGVQLYIAITSLNKPTPAQLANGVSVGISRIPAKPAWLAEIKSCNYLANVLMKKEAIDQQFDFMVSLDEEGHIAESATENILMIDEKNTLIFPEFKQILKGTMMMRTLTLAKAEGVSILQKSITAQAIQNAKEIILTGTTLNVLPVTKFNNKIIGDGSPGKITRILMRLMEIDIDSGINSIAF